ncbi:hypothetical protein HY29_09925 [Hyphomonas beringensis]|uniref:Uncharacterized protein n=1 Tax=Hyphomonas beringensis TaxID=1280946 RepID=A0A062UH50_9PROT|nr:hypothetical protein [Hyphomonas beringensis]KCZ55914.1 hypothetical protein HY29_09925 [Hyphomonas beringensis]
MPVLAWFDTAETWVQEHVLPGGEMAAFGFVMMLLIIAAVVVILFVLLAKTVRRALMESGLRRAAKDKSPGYRILLAPPGGLSGAKAGKWLMSALQDHLGAFNFGAPFKLFRTSHIPGGLEGRALARARRRMIVSQADMFLWTERTGRGDEGFLIHGLSRGGGLRAEEARPFTLALPGRIKNLDGQLPRIAAYFLARELQPALANPQSFRPEKMKLLAEALGEMLDDCASLSPVLLRRLEADFCATGVHVAEQAGDLDALDRVLRLRQGHLQAPQTDRDSWRVVQSHMDIGRALIARSMVQFDRKQVEDAISHLSKVIEALQADPTIQRAQTVSDTMAKAKNMLETRKRFAVNFGA